MPYGGVRQRYSQWGIVLPEAVKGYSEVACPLVVVCIRWWCPRPLALPCLLCAVCSLCPLRAGCVQFAPLYGDFLGWAIELGSTILSSSSSCSLGIKAGYAQQHAACGSPMCKAPQICQRLPKLRSPVPPVSVVTPPFWGSTPPQSAGISHGNLVWTVWLN
jgi:hypothetical protein